MKELLLKYTDIDGNERTLALDGEILLVGRHSENDLTIADGRLSRRHLQIERVDDELFVSDCGSSNGTELNGERLLEARAIKGGDKLSLGGFEIIIVDANLDNDVQPAEVTAEPQLAAEPVRAVSPPLQPRPPDPVGIPRSFFFIAPAMALLVLLLVGAVLYFGGSKKKTPPIDEVFTDPTPVRREDRSTPGGTVTPSNDISINANSLVNSGPPANGPNVSETASIERAASLFLQKAAANDKQAIVTGAEAKDVGSRVKSLAASQSFADNLASARKNAAAIKTAASTKGLSPQLVAAAALAKLDNSRGDVLQTVQSMLEPLSQLAIKVGNEHGNDCLLMMAAYDQGDPSKMRNMLQQLALNPNETPVTIRSIWYLKKIGKITDTEFDLAVRFLAAGAVMQNPKDLGVNAEAVTF